MLVRSGKSGRDKVITMLYKNELMRTKAMKFVTNNSGSREDALSVFGDSVLTLVKQIVARNDLSIDTSVDNYLAGIVRYTWLNELRKRGKTTTVEAGEEVAYEDSGLLSLISKDRHQQLHHTLATLGSKCKEVLMLWANGYSMKEIAEQCNYKSATMAKKKKYKCFKTLIELIEQSPKLKERLQ